MRNKLIGLFLLLSGVAIGALLRASVSPNQPDGIVPATTPLAMENVDFRAVSPDNDESLQNQITRLLTENRVLQSHIEQLERQLDEQAQSSILGSTSERSQESPSSITSLRETSNPRKGAAALTIETLMEAGIEENVAQNLKSRLDDLTLQRLYLRDQARREGWLGKEQYRDQIRALNDAQTNLRTEFGEDVFARYLFAMGRPNQVTVQSVIDNSPAFNAGLQAGDRILSYGEQAVFNAGDVRRGTQTGTSNELVPVRIVRDGLELNIYIPRGPMGIQMTSNSVKPGDS